MFTGATYRILDANANRAREALRVLEDYVRFALDDDALAAELKGIRHDLAGLLLAHLPSAILHRDTANDVGTDNKTPSEARRESLAAVVTAAGKRLGEALRVLEEILKTGDAPAAGGIERLRYRFYIVEQSIAHTLRPSDLFAPVRLYVLITEALCAGRPWLQVAAEAITGGADCLQLREKSLDSAQLLARAQELVKLCHSHGVLCIINDRPDIALLSDADGVHVGQEDLPPSGVRRIIGPQKILGVSTHRIEQARQAELEGADYIGVGPVFPSSTKPREILPGLAYARQVAAEIRIPAVAIAGITADNVQQVVQAGIRAVAVTAAVISSPDVVAAAKALKRPLVDR